MSIMNEPAALGVVTNVRPPALVAVTNFSPSAGKTLPWMLPVVGTYGSVPFLVQAMAAGSSNSSRKWRRRSRDADIKIEERIMN